MHLWCSQPAPAVSLVQNEELIQALLKTLFSLKSLQAEYQTKALFLLAYACSVAEKGSSTSSSSSSSSAASSSPFSSPGRPSATLNSLESLHAELSKRNVLLHLEDTYATLSAHLQLPVASAAVLCWLVPCVLCHQCV